MQCSDGCGGQLAADIPFLEPISFSGGENMMIACNCRDFDPRADVPDTGISAGFDLSYEAVTISFHADFHA